MNDPRILYITTEDKKEAKAIGGELIKKKLCACVNIIDGMESMYWWQGELQSDSECILLVKTTGDLTEKVTREVKKRHSYDVPCVVSLKPDPDEGNREYLDWITDCVQKSNEPEQGD